MIAMQEIERFCQKLARNYHPSRVVLFGSYAAGDARDDSDVDLLVSMDYRGNRLGVAAGIIRDLKPRFAVDLIIRTEEELSLRLQQNDEFLTKAMQNGRVLYETVD
jgi:predicted nucleotidyltransferase